MSSFTLITFNVQIGLLILFARLLLLLLITIVCIITQLREYDIRAFVENEEEEAKEEGEEEEALIIQLPTIPIH